MTEAGIAVNPCRPDLADRLRDAGLPLVEIAALKAKAQAHATGLPPTCPDPEARVVALSEYRDGTVTDLIRAVAA